MEYDGAGHPVKMIDPLLQVTTMEYDPNGNLIRTVTPDGASISQTYNENNQVASITDKQGYQTTYNYDLSGNRIKQTDPEGGVFLFAYNKNGKQTAVEDALLRVESYQYDSMGNLIQTTKPNGSVIRYQYNGFNQLEQIEAPDHGVTSFQYDAEGNLIKTTFPNGTTTSTLYGAMGRVLEETNVYGIKTSYTYDALGQVLTKRESGRETKDRITTLEYDTYGRLIKTTSPTGSFVSLEYNNNDQVIKETTSDNRVTTYAYDALNRVIEVVEPSGAKTTTVYDANNQVVSQTKEAQTVAFAYDKNGNLRTTIYPDKTETSATYNKTGQILSERDEAGKETTYTYDRIGQVLTITDPLGQNSSYAYDTMGNVTEVTESNNTKTKYVYNEMNQLQKVVEADGKTAKYEYDQMGNLVETTLLERDGISLVETDLKRRTVRYTYTDQGAIHQVNAGSKDVETYAYNKDGSLSSITYPSKKTIDYTYDPFGNLVKTVYNKETAITMEYDAFQRLIKRVDSLGETTYQYEKSGRIANITQTGEGTLAYQYDLYGNLKTLAYGDGSAVHYTYDLKNRMTIMETRNKERITYTYDDTNNLIKQINGDNSVVLTTYDALHRITSTKTCQENGSLISSYTYGFDALSRVSSEQIQDAKGQTMRSYAYDATGKLISYEQKLGEQVINTTYAYDPFGNKTLELTTETGKETQKKTFVYNDKDQLTEQRTNGETTGTYTYDIDGNVIEKTEAGSTTQYTYTVDNLLETTTVNGVLQDSIVYDGSRLKAFELLRKEYPATQVHEDVQLQETLVESTQVLTEWVTKLEERVLPVDSVTYQTNTQSEEVVTGKDYDKTMEAVAVGLGSIAPPMTEHFLSFAKQFFTDIKTVLTKTFFKRDLSSGVRTETDVIKEQISSLITKEEVVTEDVTTTETKAITVAYYEPTRYVYDVTQANPEVLLEKTSATGSISAYYEYGAGGRYAKNGEQIYVYDGRGSVSEVTTDEQIVAQYRYDPYGNLSQGTVGQDRAYTYNAQQYIPQTGLQYLRARHYDASTGNFTSKDTYLGSQTNLVTQNRYTYGNNNPVSYQDPSGHAGLFSKIVSAAKSVVSKAVKTVTAVAKSVTKAVVSTVQKVVAAVQTAVKTTASAVSKVVQTVTKAVQASAKGVVTSAKAAASGVKTTASSVVSTATQMINQVTSSLSSAPGISNSVAGIAARAATSSTASTGYTVYNTVASIELPTINRYNSLKAPARGVKQTSVTIEEDTVPLSSGDVSMAQMEQQASAFWMQSRFSSPPDKDASEFEKLSYFYYNLSKVNPAVKGSAIGLSNLVALYSIQKEQLKKNLEQASTTVGVFQERQWKLPIKNKVAQDLWEQATAGENEMGNVNETFVTAEQLSDMGFTGIDDYMVTSLNETLEKYSITESKYIQHFLAQCRQEGGFALTEAGWLSEEAIKKYTQKYEPGTSLGKDLGNTEVGDGYLYRGGGYIQMTGRYNYQSYADNFDDPAIRVKIMSEGADYVAKYLAWDAAGYWWSNNGMNTEIDNGATATQVSRGVNRGVGNMYNENKTPAHLTERLNYYKKALEVIK